MTTSAIIIADSISPQGKRMRTWQVNCHRFILPEVNTHRILSRNWASSRAIPTAKLIQMVRENPATPIHWGKNQPGMQAHEQLQGEDLYQAKRIWEGASRYAVIHAEQLASTGAHKQIVNRVLEPYLWVRGVISSTNMENFYALRRHADSQPEIKALADAMWEAEQASTPVQMEPGDWHLPYVGPVDWELFQADHPKAQGTYTSYEDALEILKKVSVARCARVSYLTHDGRETTVEEDAALYDRLVGSMPLHASPCEHQATPDEWICVSPSGNFTYDFKYPEQHANLTGWRQYRKLLPGEFVPD